LPPKPRPMWGRPFSRRMFRRWRRCLALPCLPPVFDLYHRVGNGGYGPAYGLMPLRPTDRPAFAGNAVAVLLFLRGAGFKDDGAPPWPLGLLPIVHRGSSVYTVVDCLDTSLPVLTFDADGPEVEADHPPREMLQPTGLGFADWLRQWAMSEAAPQW